MRIEGDTAARLNVDVALDLITIRLSIPAPPKFPEVHNQQIAAELIDLLTENSGKQIGIAEVSVTLAERADGRKEDAKATIQEKVRCRRILKEEKNGGRAAISIPINRPEAA